MRSNLRGDSGLSDSQFMRSQKFFIEKHKDSLDKMEECSRIEMMRRRYQSGAKSPKSSLWVRIKNFFRWN